MYKDRDYLEFRDRMEEGFLQKIADHAVEGSYRKVPVKERLILTIKAIPVNLSLKTYRPMSLITAGIFLLLIIAALFARKWRLLIHLLLLIPATLIPWGYMIYMGKPAARVASGIWYADLLFLLALAIANAEKVGEWLDRKSRFFAALKVAGKIVLAAFLAALLFIGVWKNHGKVEKNTKRSLASGQVRAQLEAWCEERPENLYICESDVINLGFDQKIMDSSVQNLYWPGGWPSKMPQAKEIWDCYQILSIESAILENDHVYIIAFEDCDMTYWTDFYREKDPSVKLTKEETLEFDGVGFAVYSVQGK